MVADKLSVEERVARGAALMDAKYPGWFMMIDVAYLDVRFCTTCVLGQFFGHYEVGLDSLCEDMEIDPEWGYERDDLYGFDSTFGNPSAADDRHEIEALNAAWRGLILTRVSEAVGVRA